MVPNFNGLASSNAFLKPMASLDFIEELWLVHSNTICKLWRSTVVQISQMVSREIQLKTFLTHRTLIFKKNENLDFAAKNRFLFFLRKEKVIRLFSYSTSSCSMHSINQVQLRSSICPNFVFSFSYDTLSLFCICFNDVLVDKGSSRRFP